ncbi:MAG TPA: transglutaminase-like domain-containing protein [Gemmatimonadales bacterium]|nr:transglutaminase-like domain-containing protein [Gemmatimonadales bacterium]
MALLVRREYFKPSAVRLEEATLRVGPGAEFYAVSLGAGPIGYASSTVDTTPEGLRVQDLMVVDVEALGKVQRTQIATDVRLTRDLRLKGFAASLDAPGAAFRAQGTVEGDTVLSVALDAGTARPQTMRVGLRHPIVMNSLLPLQLAFGHQLAPGKTYAVRVFDPRWMEERDVTVRVLAESTLVVPDSARRDSAAGRWVPAHLDSLTAWKVAEESDGIATESWIDRQGRVVSAVSPIGFRMDRMPFEMAVENWRRSAATRVAAGAGGDVVAATAIAANVPLQPHDLDVLRVVLGDVPLAGFDLAGGRQSLAGDTLVVRRETGVGGVLGRGQPRYDARLPVTDTALAADLAPEPLVQSDDPRVQAQARQIAGRERRAGPVAELLTRWVHDNLKKEITISVPSAVQVLEERRGDCNEHTVLYVALARALGLPARTAAGLVYLSGHFYYHAWPEVWLGEWVAVDPTFGQFPADASHLRFVIGGLARQVELLRLIGRLHLTVVGRPG